MSELEIIDSLGKKLDCKFHKANNPRNIFFDLAEREATYSLDTNNNVIGLKIKGYDLPEIPKDIAKLKNLNILNLSGNKISDLGSIEKLYEITALNLSGNNIVDLKQINNLTKIKWLNLQFNNISDISTVFNLKQIRKLYLDNNEITAIAGISRLTFLKDLSLESNKIKDIKPLSYCIQLQKIDLSHNRISSIASLLKLEMIEELNISRNRIADVPDLRPLRHLVSFKIAFNRIKSTKVFEGLRCSIDANGYPIKDVYIFQEPKQGVLNVDGLTNITSNIIDQIVTEKGSMVGIFGKWGRGKTFFWNELSKKMQNKNYEIVEFLAWKYHDTPASWAYLYEAFAKTFYKKPKKTFTFAWIPYLLKIILTNFRRDPILNLLRLIISIVVPVFLFFGIKENAANISGSWEFIDGLEFKLGFWGTYSVIVSYYFSKIFSLNIPNIFKRISAKSFENLLGMQAAIEREFVFLTKLWKKRIIIFVDDLDRCSEDRILSVIDSLRIMTENKYISDKVTIIAAIDERILKRVIKNKYKKMAGEDDQVDIVLNALTREYLDKLFLFGIKLSALSNEEKVEIFDNYTNSLQVLFGSLTFSTPEKEINTETQRVFREDFTFIRKYLKLIDEITPRQIRIIYNKFILANEIMKLKTQQNELKIDQKEIIIALIMWFSIKEKIEDLNKFFGEINNDEKMISKQIFEKDFETTGKMWLKYIDIIRTTVTY